MRKCNSYSGFECIYEPNNIQNKKIIHNLSFYTKEDFYRDLEEGYGANNTKIFYLKNPEEVFSENHPNHILTTSRTFPTVRRLSKEGRPFNDDPIISEITPNQVDKYNHIDQEDNYKMLYKRNELYSDFKKELLLFNITREAKNNNIFGDSSDSSRELQDLGESRKIDYWEMSNNFTEMNQDPKSTSTAFTKFINNLFENPEGRMTNLQRISIIVFTCFETYRTIISSFLTVFVPQNCGGYSCTILQNTIPKDNLEIAAISINTFMAFYFCTLFTIESIREKVVKKYLTTDKSFTTDKEYLMKMLLEMKPNEKERNT